MLDPWVALAAIATATERVCSARSSRRWPGGASRSSRARRRRSTCLSGGRLVLGAGLGGDRGGELSAWGEERTRGPAPRCSTTAWPGWTSCGRAGFEPRPVVSAARPRIPVWLAARWPNRRPVARAARWDGVFPIDLEPAGLAELVGELRELRGGTLDGFDVVVTNRPGTDVAPWAAAGATWCLTGWGPQPSAAEVEAVVEAGPDAA